MKVFVTGIGTGVGKTIVSAILCEAFKADYWKPIQAGNLKDSDLMRVKKLVSNRQTVFHPEVYRLKLAASPHHAAAIENEKIELEKISLPKTSNHLIIEGAGGVLVPLNQNELMIDMIDRMNLPVIIVSHHYLGSINHTLLSAEALRSRGLHILGIVFNGDENKATEQVILRMSKLKMLGRIKKERRINRKMIAGYAAKFRSSLNALFN